MAKLGLSIRGEGANTMAYLGFWKSWLQHDIAPDVIIASSAGCLVAAAIAAGKSYDEAVEAAKKFHLDRYVSIDAMKSSALVDPQKVGEYLSDYLGDLSFSDLQIPLLVQVTNLSKKQSEIISKGNVVEAIVASLALPLAFPHLEIDGTYYTDGDLTATNGIDVLKEHGAEKTVIWSISRDFTEVTNNYPERMEEMVTLPIEALRGLDAKYNPADLTFEFLKPKNYLLNTERALEFTEPAYTLMEQRIEEVLNLRE